MDEKQSGFVYLYRWHKAQVCQTINESFVGQQGRLDLTVDVLETILGQDPSCDPTGELSGVITSYRQARSGKSRAYAENDPGFLKRYDEAAKVKKEREDERRSSGKED